MIWRNNKPTSMLKLLWFSPCVLHTVHLNYRVYLPCAEYNLSWGDWKHTPLDQFSLACCSGAKPPSPFHSLFCPLALLAQPQLSVTGCVEVKDVDSDSDSGVYTPEEHFPKLSPCLAPPGVGGWIIKMCFCAGMQRSRGAGMGRGSSAGNFQAEPLKVKGGGKQEGEREERIWAWSSAQRLWLGGEIWSGAQRIMLVCWRRQVIVERICRSTQCCT